MIEESNVGKFKLIFWNICLKIEKYVWSCSWERKRWKRVIGYRKRFIEFIYLVWYVNNLMDVINKRVIEN